MLRLLCSLFTLLLCDVLYSQGSGDMLIEQNKKNLIVRNFSINEGLASNSIRKIGKLANGYLFVATYDGISAFDGKNFINFNTSNVPAMKSNNIYDLFIDSQNRIWFGTHNGILAYDGEKFYSPKELQSLNNQDIQQIILDSNGVLWIGTSANGLFTFKNNKLLKVNEIPDLEKSIISLLFADNHGNVWIGTENGSLYKYDGKKFISILNAKITNGIFSAVQDSSNNYYFGTRKGLFTYKNDFISLVSDKVNFINDLCLDKKGRLWLATNSGLYYYKKEQNQFNILKHNDELVNQIIQTVYFDKEDIIWVGTYRKGLIQLRQGPFENFPFDEIGVNQIPSATIEYNDSTLLISTDEGELYQLRNKKLEKLEINSILKGNRVKSIYLDSKNSVWICSYKGLIKIDEKGRHIKINLNGLPDQTIRNVVETADGNYWIGTRQTGLHKISKNFSIIKTINTYNNLSSNFIMSLVKGKKGNIFVATKNGFDILFNDSIVDHYDVTNGLPDNLVFNIYEDEKGIIWIATIKGLSRLKNGVFTNFNKANGLIDDKIFDVIEDDYGYLWLAATNGLIRVKKSDLDEYVIDNSKKISSVLFDRLDGMHDAQYVSASKLLKTKNGNILVNTHSGISILDPSIANSIHTDTSFIIRSINSESVNYFNNKNRYIFNASTKYIQIDFSYIDFISPEKVEFNYILEPFDAEWQTSGNYRFVKYTNLPPGDYNFKVQALIKSTSGTKLEKSIKFSIKHAFYETLWFKIIIGAFLILSIWFSYIIRVKTIEHQKKVLEHEVLERTKEINIQKASIEQHLKELESHKSEIDNKNEEILLAGNKIEQAYLNLKILSELGQEITSYLNEDEIVMAVYHNVNEQMDTDLLGIGNYLKDDDMIKLSSIIYKGKKIPPSEISIYEKNCILCYSLLNNVEIISNNVQNDYPEYSKTFPEISSFKSMTSVIAIPIRSKGEMGGILTVQSYRKDSYSEYHFSLLRNLAVYIGIAIENSKTYKKIKEQKDELIKVNASKDRMFSIIGHDLRGPVGTIKSFLDLIIENPEMTNEENTFEILKTMQQSLGSAYALLDNLLLWARSQRGQLEFAPSSFYIRQPIDEIVNLVSENARNKNISLDSLINYNGLVFADQNMITTVLRNLVSNAIKFTQKGGKIVLSTGLVSETLNGVLHEKIEIQVIDNGIGIKKSDIGKILEVNEIYSTPGTDKESGSGLGIGICIDFLKKHNQKLHINNNKDFQSIFEKGSTFKFYLGKSMENDEEND